MTGLRIAFAWELGGYLAHINRCATLATTSAKQGHHPFVLTRDVSRAWALPGLEGIDVLQAPVWQRRAKRLRRAPESLAEILLLHGYRRHQELGALVDAWIRLLRVVQADTMMADYAPTAMLAAHIAGIPATTFGQSFSMPPPCSPLTPFPHVKEPDRARLERVEAYLLEIVNRVARERGHPGFDSLLPLFRTPGDIICGIPELDCYAHERKPGERFVASFGAGNGGVRPAVEPTTPPGVFAYLKAEAVQTQSILKALASSDHDSWVYCSGINPRLRRMVENSGVHLSDSLLDIPYIAQHCRSGICHGGHDTVNSLLIAGLPVLIAPMQVEQRMNGEAIERAEAGRLVPEGATSQDIALLLSELHGNSPYTDNARSIGSRYRDVDPGSEVDRIVADAIARQNPVSFPSGHESRVASTR